MQPALASGEALCDTVNVFLIASGLKPIKPERKAAAEGQAAQSRLRAKQMENITQYLKACVDLGVPKAQLFDAEDLYDDRNFATVVKNVHALAQVQFGAILAQFWRNSAQLF